MPIKVRTTVTIDKELMDWILEKTKEKRFASTSHAIEYALQRLKDREREDVHFGVINEDRPFVPNSKRNT